MKSFKTREHFRAWLERHHATEKELMLRLYKVHTASKGIGYREALDEALCYGWIDGVRRALDADSFTQRFTPRKAKSNWSAVNIRRAGELIAEGRMRPPGLRAFKARDAAAKAPYSFEHGEMRLAPEFEKALRASARAWAYWSRRPPYQRKVVTHWVMSAKREETRARRFAILLASSIEALPIPPLR